MKKMSLKSSCIYMMLLGSSVFAQQKAVTDSGEEVVLYADGTWKATNSAADASTITTNAKKFVKKATSTFLLKSTKFNVGCYLDSKQWSFKKSGPDEASEFSLQSKTDDLYGMIISEQIVIPIENLRTIAFNNAKEAAPDTKITKEEYRTVNGVKVLMMQMEGTIQGIQFKYFGYYYSNAKGTVQFLTYTSKELFASKEAALEDLLNGFVELK